MTRYSLFVLKVSLTPTNQRAWKTYAEIIRAKISDKACLGGAVGSVTVRAAWLR